MLLPLVNGCSVELDSHLLAFVVFVSFDLFEECFCFASFEDAASLGFYDWWWCDDDEAKRPASFFVGNCWFSFLAWLLPFGVLRVSSTAVVGFFSVVV